MKRWRSFLWFGTLVGISGALLLMFPASQVESGSTKTATIMVTTSGNGETSPCG